MWVGAKVSFLAAVVMLILIVVSVSIPDLLNNGGCITSSSNGNAVTYSALTNYLYLQPGCTAKISVTYFGSANPPTSVSITPFIWKLSSDGQNASLIDNGEVVVSTSLTSVNYSLNTNTIVIYTVTASKYAEGSYILGLLGGPCPGIYMVVRSNLNGVSLMTNPVYHGCMPVSVKMVSVVGASIVRLNNTFP